MNDNEKSKSWFSVYRALEEIIKDPPLLAVLIYVLSNASFKKRAVPKRFLKKMTIELEKYQLATSWRELSEDLSQNWRSIKTRLERLKAYGITTAVLKDYILIDVSLYHEIEGLACGPTTTGLTSTRGCTTTGIALTCGPTTTGTCGPTTTGLGSETFCDKESEAPNNVFKECIKNKNVREREWEESLSLDLNKNSNSGEGEKMEEDGLPDFDAINAKEAEKKKARAPLQNAIDIAIGRRPNVKTIEKPQDAHTIEDKEFGTAWHKWVKDRDSELKFNVYSFIEATKEIRQKLNGITNEGLSGIFVWGLGEDFWVTKLVYPKFYLKEWGNGSLAIYNLHKEAVAALNKKKRVNY